MVHCGLLAFVNNTVLIDAAILGLRQARDMAHKVIEGARDRCRFVRQSAHATSINIINELSFVELLLLACLQLLLNLLKIKLEG